LITDNQNRPFLLFTSIALSQIKPNPLPTEEFGDNETLFSQESQPMELNLLNLQNAKRIKLKVTDPSEAEGHAHTN